MISKEVIILTEMSPKLIEIFINRAVFCVPNTYWCAQFTTECDAKSKFICSSPT